MSYFLWWSLYTLTGIWAQNFIPGVDLFVPGLIVCLQEEGWRPALWLSCIWLLVQEGIGGLGFGVMLLWYAGLWTMFFAGRHLLESKGALFIVLLGGFSALYHLFLVQVFANLQGLDLVFKTQVYASLWQALLFPLLWFAVSLLYFRFLGQRRRCA